MQVGWYHPVPPRLTHRRGHHERQRHDPRVRIPRLHELKGLANILAKHKLGLQPTVHARRPERLDRRQSIRRVHRVGNRHEPDPFVEERPQPQDELEAAYRALVCGTRDYVRKCGFHKAVIGLSGGVDSALVASIATDALGPENVWGVGMPSQYSSEGSLGDARQLAENLRIQFTVLPIKEIFASYRATLADVFAGRPEDVTEENIQARIRGNLLMALSNKFGSLVLSTGNKSELAVGYCTLYGDMAGGLAVISDVPKTMVYALAEYVNREREVIPRATLTKPPSAELRPNQKDQDTLPPYEILDRILKAYIEDLRSPKEIADNYGYSLDLVRQIARKVDQNEYKRKQSAPGLKITSKAFSVGRRFPVAYKFFDSEKAKGSSR